VIFVGIRCDFMMLYAEKPWRAYIPLLAAARVLPTSGMQALEILALRQQVCAQDQTASPLLKSPRSMFWATLRHVWSHMGRGPGNCETRPVVGWHRAGFSSPAGGDDEHGPQTEIDS